MVGGGHRVVNLGKKDEKVLGVLSGACDSPVCSPGRFSSSSRVAGVAEAHADWGGLPTPDGHVKGKAENCLCSAIEIWGGFHHYII